MQNRIPSAPRRRDRGRFRLRARRGFSLRSERGGMLIEVMMSALLVAMVSTAVFKSIDGAASVSGQSKARAIAASLAQKDLERMRAMDPRTLSSYSLGPVATPIDGVNYQVSSSAAWVSDRSDTESCTKGSGRVTYVRITSSVTWPNMVGSKPISESSVIAINNAYAKGSLSIKVLNAAGAAVPGVPVNITTPSLNKSTNDQGCAVFDGLASGVYTGNVNRAGYVTPLGVQNIVPVNGWSVTTGGTSVTQYDYDLAGSVALGFDTVVNGAAPVAVTNQSLTNLELTAGGMPSPGVRAFTLAANSSSFTNSTLYPFTGAYTATLTGCGGTTNNTTFTVTPGAAATGPRTFRFPAIRVKTTLNGSASSALIVKVTPPSGCGSARTYTPNAATGMIPETSAAEAAAIAWPKTTGNFTVCVEGGTGTTGDPKRKVTQTVSGNTVDAGQIVPATPAGAAINVQTTGTSKSPTGTC